MRWPPRVGHQAKMPTASRSVADGAVAGVAAAAKRPRRLRAMRRRSRPMIGESDTDQMPAADVFAPNASVIAEDVLADQPPLAPNSSVAGVANEPVAETEGEQEAARRRGRRGGRRRKRDETPPPDLDAEQPATPPFAITGPTPADPFAGQHLDLYELMDRYETSPAQPDAPDPAAEDSAARAEAARATRCRGRRRGADDRLDCSGSSAGARTGGRGRAGDGDRSRNTRNRHPGRPDGRRRPRTRSAPPGPARRTRAPPSNLSSLASTPSR